MSTVFSIGSELEPCILQRAGGRLKGLPTYSDFDSRLCQVLVLTILARASAPVMVSPTERDPRRAQAGICSW